jgi:hypothetical protein
MANDQAKRSLLDQLTASATQPPPAVPDALAPAVSGDPSTFVPPSLANASATAPGSTANLESIAASPDTLNANVEATKQSSENDHPGFLKKLARVAGGFTGLADPNSSPQAGMGAKIGEFAGRTGNALAEAAGTPEQKQLANERSQMPLKLAQLQNEMDYRRAVVGNAANKTNLQYGPEGTSRLTAEAAQQNADSNEGLRNAHQALIEAQMNGETLVTPEAAAAAGDPSLANKRLPAIQYQQRITNPINNQLKASGGTKTVDLGADGVWGYNPFLGRTQRLGDSPSIARSNSMLLRTQLPVNDAQGNTLGWVNPQTNSFTPVGSINAKGGGAPLSASLGGDVIPPKPTSSMLTQGQMAQTIQPMIPQIQNEVQQLAQEIGPGEGRWNDFWVNRGGVNDPAYAGLNQDLQLFATALGKAHFGASMPEGFVKDMMRDFGTAQSPEDLIARLEHSEGWINGYAARVGGGMPAVKPTTAVPKKGTTALTSSTPAPGGVQEGATATGPNGHKITFSGGRWLDAATKQPIR